MNKDGTKQIPLINADMAAGADMVINAMSSRSDLLRKLFDPRRDIDTECGYSETIGEDEYRKMYDRELGQRVVGVYPEETWKKLPIIQENPDPDVETPFELSLTDVESQHHLLHYMQRADEMSGIGHYGIILWGLDDGLTLDQPVEGHEGWEEVTGKPATAKGREHRLLYIRVLDESLVTIAAYENDPTNPRYGLPTYYTITLTDPCNQESGATTTPNTTASRVHWTRVTHVADNRKTSEVLGMPRMKAVWNRLCDLRKVLGGCGEMFWKGGFPGISLETQPGLENAELDETTTRQAMSDYMNGLQRYIALTGMAAKSLEPQIADPTSTFEVQVKAVCITLGVPYRVFMGIEEGVVSGDQTTKAWLGRLANRQTRYVTPLLINPIIQRLIEYGVLAPPAEPHGWEVIWPDLMVPSELERAEVASKKTEALTKYIQGGVDTLIPPMEFLTKVMGISEDDAKQIIIAALEHIGGMEDENEVTPGRLPAPVVGGDTPPEDA